MSNENTIQSSSKKKTVILTQHKSNDKARKKEKKTKTHTQTLQTLRSHGCHPSFGWSSESSIHIYNSFLLCSQIIPQIFIPNKNVHERSQYRTCLCFHFFVYFSNLVVSGFSPWVSLFLAQVSSKVTIIIINDSIIITINNDNTIIIITNHPGQ